MATFNQVTCSDGKGSPIISTFRSRADAFDFEMLMVRTRPDLTVKRSSGMKLYTGKNAAAEAKSDVEHFLRKPA